MPEQTPNILIGTPVANGVVTHDYFQFMVVLTMHFQRLGWGFRVVTQPDGLVTRSRNAFASTVVRNEEYTHLLMFDADVTASPEGIERIIRSGKDFVGCVVPFRKTHWDRVEDALSALPDVTIDDVRAVANGYAYWPEKGARPVDGFIEAHAIGSAIMLISREALVAISESELVDFATAGLPASDGEHSGWTFFDPYVDENGVYLSEDYALCDRWRKLGGAIWADLETTTRHIGPVVVEGDIAQSITTATRLVRARKQAS
ncbi:MAG TPA: hypothetical protein VK139_04825 [Microbacteriaceae bacterium]|nr:hypothetical protein [Microbacteriaceae bacterium]